MDFGLSDDQLLLKDTVRRYLESKCPTTRVRAIMENETGHDPALWQGLADLGVPGLAIPTAHGGSGLELLELALAAEELGWACTPGPFLACAMAGVALVASDDVDAQTRGLAPLPGGRAIGTAGVGEEGGGWGAARLTTRARDGRPEGRNPPVPPAAAPGAF